MSTPVKQCVWCETGVQQPARRGRPKTYCSEDCRENATRRRFFFICDCGRVRLSPFSTKTQSKCDVCRLFSTMIVKANDRQRERDRWRRDKNDQAYKERKRRERLTRRPPRPREPESPCKNWPKLKLSSCRWCDLPYWHTDLNRFCSEQCLEESSQSNIRNSEWLSGKRRAPCCHICPDCGSSVPEMNMKCDLCKQITKCRSRQRRKARRRGVPSEPYTLLEIAERDGFLCYLCGEDVDMSLEGHFSHDLAPTREHVIPISRGGPDTKNNVRLAHRKCNWLKGDKMPDLQVF